MRITHVIKMPANDVRKYQASGFYRDMELAEVYDNESDEVQDKIDELDGAKRVYTKDNIHTILEMHVDLDLPGYEDANEAGESSGISLPYIVSIDENSSKILSIRRNYEEQDPLKIKKTIFRTLQVSSRPWLLWLWSYSHVGWFIKVCNLHTTSTHRRWYTRQLPSGFKARGLRIRDDDQPLVPGEFRDVDAPAGEISSFFSSTAIQRTIRHAFSIIRFCYRKRQIFCSRS